MPTEDVQGNVALVVSNQSFDVNPVDIEITIDDQVVVQGYFDVKGDQMPQHNWQRLEVELEEGEHSLLVKSKNGRAKLERTIEVPAIHTITIAYWNDGSSTRSEREGYFTIELSSGETATM